MKIECSKDKLKNSVSKAEKITGRNLSLPVLNCLVLEAKNGNLSIKATNLDLGIEINIPVKVQKEGLIAVPGSILNAFISNLSHDDSVRLEVIDNNLSIGTPHNSTIIKAVPADDFPSIPKITGGVSLEIFPTDFASGLKSVWYAAAVSGMKPELSSVYVYQDSGDIIFAATDSFRLAEKKVSAKKTKEFNDILIPFKNIPEILRTLEEMDGPVKVDLNKNQISFSRNGVYLTSRIIDGVFPDYKQIIPKNSSTEAVLLKQDVIDALKLANIFSDSFHQINIKALPGDKIFEVKTKNSDVGESAHRISAVFKGDNVDINFNYRYIIDCFQSIASDSVSLQFNGAAKPMVIRGVGDPSFLYLVMPMNK